MQPEEPVGARYGPTKAVTLTTLVYSSTPTVYQSHERPYGCFFARAQRTCGLG